MGRVHFFGGIPFPAWRPSTGRPRRAPLIIGVNGQAPVSFGLVLCKGLGIRVVCKARSDW